MIEIAFTTFVTLFVIFDPFGNVPIFLSVTQGQSPEKRRATAFRASAVAAVILAVFGVGGDQFLKMMGISLPAFRIAGGILLLLLAVEMVFARHSGLRVTTSDEEAEAAQRNDVAVFPLAVPLIAGPGAMASMLLLMGQATSDIFRIVIVLAVMILVLALNFCILVIGARILGRVGVTGVNVLTRIFGVVLAALAVQFIIDGVREVFPV
ncbi:MAG: MarC family protein [Alphaproteobacteria bacterium]